MKSKNKKKVKHTRVFYGNQYKGSFRVGQSRVSRFFSTLWTYLSFFLVAGFIVLAGLVLIGTDYGQVKAEPEVRIIELIDETVPPVLSRIAECESNSRHFGKSGQVLAVGNKNGSVDVGRYQINVSSWGEKATELGYDLYDEKENELMALWIYENYGTEPWKWTKSCWR